MNKHHAHLEQDLEAILYNLLLTILKALRAVSTLKQKSLTCGSLSQLIAQSLDLPRCNQWRLVPNCIKNCLEMFFIRIVYLLSDLLCTPRARTPV